MTEGYAKICTHLRWISRDVDGKQTSVSNSLEYVEVSASSSTRFLYLVFLPTGGGTIREGDLFGVLKVSEGRQGGQGRAGRGRAGQGGAQQWCGVE